MIGALRSALRRTRRGLAVWVRTPAQGRLLARMLGWRIVLPVLKRAIPLRSLVRLMWSDARLPAGVSREAVVRLAGVVYKPDPAGTRGNCLERSLLVYRYLAQACSDPTLVVGVDPSDGGVRGHAWVLVDGRPVHDSAEFLARQTPLVSFGAGGRRIATSPGAPPPLPLADA